MGCGGSVQARENTHLVSEALSSNQKDKAQVILVNGDEGAEITKTTQRIANDFSFLLLSAKDILAQSHDAEVESLLASGRKEEALIKALRNTILKSGSRKGKFVIEGYLATEEEVNFWKQYLNSICEVKSAIYLEISNSSDRLYDKFKDYVQKINKEEVTTKIPNGKIFENFYTEIFNILSNIFQVVSYNICYS